MLLSRTPSHNNNWAYSEDIPGSRCGPEDGPWPRPYQVLEESELWRELTHIARPQTKRLETSSTERGWRADSVNFQPSPKTRTQDRYVVTQLDIHGQMWSLTGVFDGHLGDATVDHVASHLPIIVRNFMQEALADACPKSISPARVSELFSRALTAFDDAIANDVLGLFGGIEGLAQFSDAQIRGIINDQHRGGSNWKKVRLCMYGTTALVSLVDPEHKNLWVANLGDCQAILATARENEDDWNIQMLTRNHNGDNDAEVERVQGQHPGEPECVKDRRVLGALAPFRCLGDVAFKQPPEFTRRIIFNLLPGFPTTAPWEAFLSRNRTAPYVSADPEVTHVLLEDADLTDEEAVTMLDFAERRQTRADDADNADADAGKGEDEEHSIGTPADVATPKTFKRSGVRRRFLIMGSDGFTDLCSGEGQKRIVESWAREMDDSMRQEEQHSHNHHVNHHTHHCAHHHCTHHHHSHLNHHANNNNNNNNHHHHHHLNHHSHAHTHHHHAHHHQPYPTNHNHHYHNNVATRSATDNMALRLLRRMLGGEDRYSVSRVLTLDMDEAWIDDTAIIVQTL